MTTIKVNQTDEEIHRLFMDADLKRWKEEIEIITIEMDFYKNLLQDPANECETSEGSNCASLLKEITDAERDNELFQKDLLDFDNRALGITECDDLQCENFFLNDHATVKESIENHFSNYRVFKKSLLVFIKTHFKY